MPALLTIRRLLPLLCALFVSGAAPAQWAYPPVLPGARAETYKTVGDTPLKLYLFEPAAPGTNRPAIVFFFGGGWQGGSPAQFEAQCRHFAARGLVAVTADYRVGSRQHAKPAECVADAKSCVRWLRQNAARLGIDPERIVAAGGSAGGHLAAATATLPGFDEPGENRAVSSVPNALVLFNPALVLAPLPGLDLKGFGVNLSPDRLGAQAADLSPAHHVKPGTPPTLILHGQADTTVPFNTAEAFAAAMKRAGNRCELIGYAGQNHGFFNAGRGDGRYYRETLAAADAFLVSLGYLAAEKANTTPNPSPAAPAPSSASAATNRPNIVVILADDLGYGDLGCYNKDSKIPTPNLDRLATQGMRFTDAHAPTSVCSPTRYALLTGRYAWRSPLKRGVLAPWDKPIITADRLTVASLLRQQGYLTAAIGKWHLGWTWPTKDGAAPSSATNRLSNVDFTKPIADGPITRGFDTYFGVDVPNYPPYVFIENDRTVGVPSLPDAGRAELFNRPGPMLPGWRMVDILPALTRRAVSWIGSNATAGRPFFLYFPLTSPHYPVVPAPEFKGKSKAGDYGDYVCQTDWTVGQVVEALQRAGVADNTLVIFTSDNGPEITGEVNPGAYDRAKEFQHFSMGELRGAKRDMWEGGHRVPFLARWPGRIQPGAVSAETICHADLMATIAALLGAPLPPNAGEDSFSILPVLLGQKSEQPARVATVHHSGSGKFAIRKGDWVLIDAPSGDDNGVHGEPQWLKEQRGYVKNNLPGELFNVREDLSERRNHYAEQPEVVRELKGLLEQYQRAGRSTPGAPQTNDAPRATVAAKSKGKAGLTTE
jgi:arylsulfatase A